MDTNHISSMSLRLTSSASVQGFPLGLCSRTFPFLTASDSPSRFLTATYGQSGLMPA